MNTRKEEYLGVALTCLSDVHPEQVSWLWPGRLPLGKLVTLDGDPGVGKSTLALTFAATITTGGDWPDGSRCEHAGDVLVMSAEDGLGDTIRPRLDAAGADSSRVHSVDGARFVDEDGQAYVDSVALQNVAALREAITDTDARLLIVDVLMAFLPGATDSYKDQAMRRILTPLANLAGETGCTILLLRHPSKGPQAKAIHAGAGSIGIIGAARVGLLAMTDSDDADVRVLAVAKSNLAQVPPSLAYRLDGTEVAGVETAVIRWMGEHTSSATDLVAATPDTTGETAVVLALVNARTKTTAHDVVDAAPHITHDNARAILSRLVHRGKIERDSRGVYSPCHIVTMSQTRESASSEDITDCDTTCDNRKPVTNDCDNPAAVSQTLSQTETTPEQGEHSDCDTCDNVTARICKTAHCGKPVAYKGLCRECLDLESAERLVTSARGRMET